MADIVKTERVTVSTAVVTTVITWIVAVIIAYSMLESRQHAEVTYTTKEVFKQHEDVQRDQFKQIYDMFKEIRDNQKKGR